MDCHSPSLVYSAPPLLLVLSLRVLRSTTPCKHAPEPVLRAGLAAQVNLHAMTAGVAMLSLYVWLMGLKQCLLARGAGSLPARLAIVSDKGKSSKEAGNLVVKEAVAAMMAHWEAPFRYTPSGTLDLLQACPLLPAPVLPAHRHRGGVGGVLQQGCWAATCVCCIPAHSGPSWLLELHSTPADCQSLPWGLGRMYCSDNNTT